MTNAQRTWNVGEAIEGSEYGRAPIGVFVYAYGGWICRRADGKWTDDQMVVHDPSSLFSVRTIIARPHDAPAHIPVYVEPITYKPDVRVLNVRFGTEEQIRMLDKIKQEANALIAERDALKHALRKAQDACQRLREERDAAKIEMQTQKAVSRRVNNMMKIDIDLPATFTPALGASPKTREDFAACPVGTQIRFTSKANVDEKDVHWEKEADDKWQSFAFGRKSFKTDNIQALVGDGLIGGFTARIISIPLARKPRMTLGDLLKEHAERRATSPVPEWKDHARIPPAPPAVIRKGEKIDTPAQYDALPPGSQVRKANGQCWLKTHEGGWWNSGNLMRDLSFPRTVLRIGHDDTAVSFDVVGVALKQDKPALRVGDMCSGKGYASLPVGSRVEYVWNAHLKPEYWEKKENGKWASNGDGGGTATLEDGNARKILRIGPEPARFHVGQVISTREEYEALPVGASVWFNKDTRFPGDKVFAFWTKEHKDKWRSGSGSGADNRNLADIGREIRSLP